MGRKVEGYWDCKYCGAKGIGGLTKTCPHCGNPQSKDVKLYLKPGPKKYLEPEVAKDYGKGADWVCSYCGSYNRYNAKICRNCGSSKKEANEDYFGRPVNSSSDNDDDSESHTKTESYQKTDDEADEPSNSQSSKLSYEKSSNDDFSIDSGEYPKQSNFGSLLSSISLKKLLVIGSGILGIIAIVMLLVSIFTPKNYSAKITAKSWERSITVQELRTFNESDWYIPDGARVYDEREEIRYYDEVIDHYETRSYQVSREEFDHYEYEYRDNGDGTFDEVSVPVYKTVYDTEYEEVPIYVEVPVYDIKYYYEIDRWCYDRTETASGTEDEPYWPDVQYDSFEREGVTSETYKISLTTTTSKPKSYSKNLSYDEWKTYDEGTDVTIEVVAGVVTKIEKVAY